MLTPEENALITRTGPATPMGEAMRRYWMPALLSEELPEADGPPVRVRLLGENLVAFRDSSGRVGLLAENCSHRGASLFFGRNEEDGLRCVYHGWKYDVDGRCLDMPGEPPESSFKERIRQRSYPCHEQGKVIWTYMGPPAKRPPPPGLEWVRAEVGRCHVSKTLEECNYLQGIEGGVDSGHSSFLHRRFDDGYATRTTEAFRAKATAPKLEVEPTDYGYRYASIRRLGDEGKSYVRVYQFIMPFHQMRAYEGYVGRPVIQGHMWVPIDDESHWVYNWIYTKDGAPLTEEEVHLEGVVTGRGPDDLLPGFRLKKNKSNDYMIDRENQRTRTFTGIEGVNTQDMAIQESMGPIYDRSHEHLGSSDTAVIAMRRLLIQAAQDVAAGRDPLGADGASDGVRPAEMLLSEKAPWSDAMHAELVARW